MYSRRSWLVLAALAVLLVAGALAFRGCGEDTATEPSTASVPRLMGPTARRAEGWRSLDEGELAKDRAPVQERAREAGGGETTAGTVAADGGLVELAQPLLADAMRAWLRVNAEAAERRVDEFCEQARKVSQ